MVSPAVKVGSKIVQAAAETDAEEVTDDLEDAVETLPDTVQNIDSPIEELGPGAAILGASYVANRVAHTPSRLSAPRLLNLPVPVLITLWVDTLTTKTITLWLKTSKI